MNSTNEIKKYVGPSGVTKVIAWILFAFTLFCAVMGFTNCNVDEDTEKLTAVRFNPVVSANGGYAYLDIVGVSDWIYMYDSATYYVAEDAENYWYIVRLNKSDFNAMSEQQDYWMRETEDAPMPEPYRVYGMVSSIGGEAKEMMAEACGYTESEFEDYLGDRYLNATTTPSENTGAGWMVGVLFGGLFWLVCAATAFSANRNAKRCIARLEELGKLEAAVAEFAAQDVVKVGKKDIARITPNFIFGRRNGSIICISDVIWAYKHVQKQNFRTVNESIMVYTRTMKQITVAMVRGTDKEDCLLQVLAAVNQGCPEALIGFTQENAKKCREIRKEIKNGTR